MPKETIFRAADPDGGHHYRGSVGRTYSHAILRQAGGHWSASAFASRPDLAEKEATRWRRFYASNAAACAARGEHDKASQYRAIKFVVAPVVVVEKRGA